MCGEEYYRSRLAALWVETVIWGAYAALFVCSVYVLIYKRPNRWFLAVTVSTFAICTSFIILDFVTVLISPLSISNTECLPNGVCVACPDTPNQFDEQLVSDVIQCIEYAFFGINQLIVDGLLIYRCFVVWQYNKLVTIPSIVLLLATAGKYPSDAQLFAFAYPLNASACTFAQTNYDIQLYRIVRDATAGEGPPPEFINDVKLYDNFGIASSSLSLAVNIVITALISLRIWWVTKDFQHSKRSGLTYGSVIAILVESGLPYSISIIIYFITYFRAPVFTIIPQSAMQQFMGIAPTLVLVRIGMGSSFDTSPVSLGDVPHDAANRTMTLHFAERDTFTIASTQDHHGGLRHRELELSPLEKGSDGQATQGSTAVDSFNHSREMLSPEQYMVQKDASSVVVSSA
ncbi:hypothetical protein EVG20_g10298 [Dentipellis fragilis]|uniref:Uncharacterized protein n=1 Tax=Dentipellis fragilis TaxID=205917 RepID=A0A4Y9XSD6_9AGAM|nr:hypothetical protein EVG20_g10298 [Dentipellis fragilis]